ncbi:dephospho-CoA kinase [Weissella coleopterorum]|uniref:Dephospho-CoA kinase n=1 Tax=Weissella coleopterorum TaxID=2714949 RepID=A0A6G8AZU8_9LACO|nr:dephospho-CoA kinase [Weissella coleopterorum]QIL50588.1 dephospho-CoA kinase [Weissella coleopterorum]
MLEIGITGGIATGKSTVAKYIQEQGYPVLDADVVSRELVRPGSIILQALARQFGLQILKDDGELDRSKLGNIVFGDEEKLKKLNSIMHPAINQELKKQAKILAQEGYDLIFLEIPLLFETKNAVGVDRIIVVTLNPDEQLMRLVQRNHLTNTEAKQRIDAQLPIDQKEALADYVVQNNQTNVMHDQVDHIIDELRSLS